MKFLKSGLLKWSLGLLLFVCLVMFFCYKKVSNDARPFLYSNADDVPQHKAALLLGTSGKLSNGWANQYFEYRIDAAVQLYKAGKINT